MPLVLKDNFRNIFYNNIDQMIKEYKIKGLVLSNISGINYFKNYISELELIANYSYNIFNNYTINELKELGFNVVTISPELDEKKFKRNLSRLIT